MDNIFEKIFNKDKYIFETSSPLLMTIIMAVPILDTGLCNRYVSILPFFTHTHTHTHSVTIEHALNCTNEGRENTCRCIRPMSK